MSYSFDWGMANGTVEKLVAIVCSQSATCPIAFVTGTAGSKDFDAKKLVSAIEQQGLQFLRNPLPH